MTRRRSSRGKPKLKWLMIVWYDWRSACNRYLFCIMHGVCVYPEEKNLRLLLCIVLDVIVRPASFVEWKLELQLVLGRENNKKQLIPWNRKQIGPNNVIETLLVSKYCWQDNQQNIDLSVFFKLSWNTHHKLLL